MAYRMMINAHVEPAKINDFFTKFVGEKDLSRRVAAVSLDDNEDGMNGQSTQEMKYMTQLVRVLR
jgi:hypothetical protein